MSLPERTAQFSRSFGATLRPPDVFRCVIRVADPQLPYLDHGPVVCGRPREAVTRGRCWTRPPIAVRPPGISTATASRTTSLPKHSPSASAISATNYNSGKSYLFIQGAKGHPGVEPQPSGVADWRPKNHHRAHLRLGRDSAGVSARIRLTTSRGTAFFGDWLFAPAAAAQSRSYGWAQKRYWPSEFAARRWKIRNSLAIPRTLRLAQTSWASF